MNFQSRPEETVYYTVFGLDWLEIQFLIPPKKFDFLEFFLRNLYAWELPVRVGGTGTRPTVSYVLRTPSWLCSRPAIQVLLKGWNIHRHTGIALHSSMSNYNQLFTANIKFLTKYIHLVLVYFFFLLIGLTKLSIRFTNGY